MSRGEAKVGIMSRGEANAYSNVNAAGNVLVLAKVQELKDGTNDPYSVGCASDIVKDLCIAKWQQPLNPFKHIIKIKAMRKIQIELSSCGNGNPWKYLEQLITRAKSTTTELNNNQEVNDLLGLCSMMSDIMQQELTAEVTRAESEAVAARKAVTRAESEAGAATEAVTRAESKAEAAKQQKLKIYRTFRNIDQRCSELIDFIDLGDLQQLLERSTELSDAMERTVVLSDLLELNSDILNGDYVAGDHYDNTHLISNIAELAKFIADFLDPKPDFYPRLLAEYDDIDLNHVADPGLLERQVKYIMSYEKETRQLKSQLQHELETKLNNALIAIHAVEALDEDTPATPEKCTRTCLEQGDLQLESVYEDATALHQLLGNAQTMHALANTVTAALAHPLERTETPLQAMAEEAAIAERVTAQQLSAAQAAVQAAELEVQAAQDAVVDAESEVNTAQSAVDAAIEDTPAPTAHPPRANEHHRYNISCMGSFYKRGSCREERDDHGYYPDPPVV